MLVQLHVKNLALIEEIEVEFGPGLNILTGETGAGKSILLGSMQMMLGTKVSKDMIRENTKAALVELLFEVKNPDVIRKLEEKGLELAEGQLILSRKITDTRSLCKINGETSTVAQLKSVAEMLLDIHGQHEHQSLLNKDKQLAILDEYGKKEIGPAKEAVYAAWKHYKKCQEILKSMDLDEEQRKREMAFLEFEINEIESASLKPGEDEELEQIFRKMNNGRKIMDSAGAVYSCTSSENGGGAAEQISKAMHEMSRITQYDAELESLYSTLGEIDGLLSDFNRELDAYMDSLNFDDETFYQTEKRLDLLNTLKAKYGKTIEDILDYQEVQQEKLDQYQSFEEHLEQAETEFRKAEKKLNECCRALSLIRRKYGKILTEAIIEGLQDMNFADVRFSITFHQKNHYTSDGFDEVEYEISTNPGEPVKPLGRVVSGGELSRIMLAIKSLLADKDEIETMIFDEIDTGISGRTAQKVSQKMALIGKHRQVLCITHLPQIAAMADTHYEIRKTVEDQETTTRIYPLDQDQCIAELGRLLSGEKMTKAVEENARELKQLANEFKQGRA